jgi:hypothetical protein
VLRLSVLAVLLVGLPTFVSDAGVFSTFHDGVFGVRWGTPLEALTSAYPSGLTLPSMQEGHVYWRVRDDRTFLGVVRVNRRIDFGLYRRVGVGAISIEYPYAARTELRAALTQMLGPSTATDSETATIRHYTWGGCKSGDMEATIVEDAGTSDPTLWLFIGFADCHRKEWHGK